MEQSAPWLQDCVVSLSPCADLLVVGREQRVVFLSGEMRGVVKNVGGGHSLTKQPRTNVFFVSVPQLGGALTTVEGKR